MGQAEVGRILERNYPKWLSYQDVMKQSTLTKDSIIRALRKMKKRPELEYKIIKGKVQRSRWSTLYRIKGGIENGTRKRN